MAIRRLTSEFGTDLIAEGDIATGAVTTDKIASDAITSTKIAANAVTTEQIVDTTTVSNLVCGTTISNVTVTTASTTALIVGMTVSGTEITAGTTIATIPTATSFTLSAVATATNVSASLTFVSGITAGKIAAGAIGATELGTTLDLSSHTVTVPAATVTAHVVAFDDSKIRHDITTLALRQAIGDNSIAYNLPNSFIDQFQDNSGIGTETNTDRNASEYVSSTIFTGASTITRDGAPIHSTGDTVGANWGTTSISVDGSDASSDTGFLNIDHGTTKMDFLTDATGSQSWTVDFWINYQSEPLDGIWTFIWGNTLTANVECLKMQAHTIAGVMYYGVKGSNITDHEDPTDSQSNFDAFTNGIWYHLAFIRDGTNDYIYQNGVQKGTYNIGTGTLANWRYLSIAMSDPALVDGHDFYFDDFRISNSVRWPSGSSFSVPTTRAVKDINTKFLLQSGDSYSNNDGDADDFVDSSAGTLTNLTGTVTSSVTTVVGNRTKVSGVILWKDAGSGTSTIGTHLKIYFTCIAGDSDWNEASYTAVTPVFSTGIKMVKLGETTCDEGNLIRYKAVWATQSAGVIETQLHGIGLNY